MATIGISVVLPIVEQLVFAESKLFILECEETKKEDSPPINVTSPISPEAIAKQVSELFMQSIAKETKERILKLMQVVGDPDKSDASK